MKLNLDFFRTNRNATNNGKVFLESYFGGSFHLDYKKKERLQSNYILFLETQFDMTEN